MNGFSALGYASQSISLVWQQTVGGLLESRLRFNKLLSWNTFPLPTLSRDERVEIIGAGHQVLAARQQLDDIALADMYPADGLAEPLQRAHDSLDRAVERGVRPRTR